MRKCKVYVNGVEAGILTEIDNPREYIFKYNTDYLENKSQAISLTMPLRKEEYRSKVLFPYFSIFSPKVKTVLSNHLYITLTKLMISAYSSPLPNTIRSEQ